MTTKEFTLSLSSQNANYLFKSRIVHIRPLMIKTTTPVWCHTAEIQKCIRVSFYQQIIHIIIYRYTLLTSMHLYTNEWEFRHHNRSASHCPSWLIKLWLNNQLLFASLWVTWLSISLFRDAWEKKSKEGEEYKQTHMWRVSQLA